MVVGLARACACMALAAALSPRVASAQEDACRGTGLETPDEVRATPPDGASEVALDVPITLAYASSIDLPSLAAALDPDDVCGGELACVLVPGAGSAPPTKLPSTLTRLGSHTLVLQPSSRLPSQAELLVLYARPGFDRPTRGELTWTTGDDVDRERPTLAVDAGGLEVLVEPPPAPCDAPAGSLRVRVSVPTPDDDGDETSVEVLAYLSRAEGLDAPALRARARPEDADQESLTLTLLLTPDEAAGAVCIALRAVDGAGRRSENAPEACFEPAAAEHSEFASSCATSAHVGRAHARDWAAACLLLLPAAARLRRRKRPKVTA